MENTLDLPQESCSEQSTQSQQNSFAGISSHYFFTKRALDLAVLFVLLPFFLPLMLVIAAIVRLSGSPVFFGQKRLGFGGREFKMWKFCTMVPNAEQVLKDFLAADPKLQAEWLLCQKLRNDPRVTPIGKFLRKTSLDELPQLWNIFLGDMSLVGPRPITDSEVERYESAFDYYVRVLPGVTGIWQVSGRNNTSYAKRVSLDVEYVKNWSLFTDLAILARTVVTVIKQEGAC